MNTDNQVSELQAFSESIFKINEELSLLATLGGGPPEPEFNQWIKTAVQDLQILLPCVRRIYEARKDQWFEQNNVLKHGYCYAQTWHELVLNSAVEFIEGVRLIGAGHACKLLRESEYESGRVQIHLKLEIAHAGKAISQAGRKTDKKKPRASENDIRKSDFYDKARNKSPQITYAEVADQWNRTFLNEEQTEQGFRQAVNRAANARKWSQERDSL